MDTIPIHAITPGMLFWESEMGQDALFLATAVQRGGRAGARGALVQSITVWCSCPDACAGKVQQHFEADRAGGYGLKLYRSPQYRRGPSGDELMEALSAAIVRYGEIVKAPETHRAESHVALAAQAEQERKDALAALKRERERCEALRDREQALLALLAEIDRHTHEAYNGVQMAERIKSAMRHAKVLP